MQTTIHIQAKMIGVKQPLIPNWALPISEKIQGNQAAALRDLIALVVEAEIEAFQSRQAERRFARLLTREQIESAARQGVVDAAARPPEAPDLDIDLRQAVSNALTAFQDGLYYVFLDDQQIETLDQPIHLETGSRVTFLRLVPLAGG